MSELYGASTIDNMDQIAKSDEVFEMFLTQDMLNGTSAQIQNFCESEIAQILVEKSVLKKPTLMRLGKVDDEKRRTKLMAYQMAKNANDPEWKKLKKFTAARKQSIAKIMKKYGKKASRLAKLSQKEYIKKSKSIKATAAEMKAQNAR